VHGEDRCGDYGFYGNSQSNGNWEMEHFDSAYRQTRELISMRPRMGQYNYVPHVQIHVALRQRGWSRRYGEHVICHMCQMYFLVYFLTLFAEYAQQGLCNGRMSVRLSVCLSACSIIRPPLRRVWQPRKRAWKHGRAWKMKIRAWKNQDPCFNLNCKTKYCTL